MYKERVNIGPKARDSKAQGALVPHSYDFDILKIEPDSVEAGAAVASLKPEIYTIGAVLIDRVVTDAYQARNVDEEVEKLLPYAPFISAGTQIRTKLHDAVAGMEHAVNVGEAAPLIISGYRRLRYLYTLLSTLLPSVKLNKGPRLFIIGGANTATEIVSQTVNTVADLVGVEDKDRLLSVVENSYPFVAELAAAHSTATIMGIYALDANGTKAAPPHRFDKRFFAIVSDGRKERLGLSDAGKMVLQSTIGTDRLRDYRSNTSPTVGCPALVNFGDGSAVETVWNWNLEIARRIIPRLASGPLPDPSQADSV